MPIVHADGRRIAGNIQRQIDWLRWIKLLDTFAPVSVGVAGNQADQRTMKETVFVVRAIGVHISIGAWIALMAHLNHDVIEWCSGDV